MDCFNDMLIWKYVMILMIMETYAVILQVWNLTLKYSQLIVVGPRLILIEDTFKLSYNN